MDGFLYPMNSGRDLINWKCSHGTFGWSVSTLSDWMIGHLFIFPACICGDNCDASSYCEHPCCLNDAYTHWGWTWDSNLCICSNIIVRFNVDVHQAHKELYVGWGSLTDFQLCIENFQFSVQWYDFHSMNVIPCDDKFVWWILMFGYLQLRKWDPRINSPDKLCGKAFSLKGVQSKQWDPGIACFGETLQDGLIEKVNLFFKMDSCSISPI